MMVIASRDMELIAIKAQNRKANEREKEST